MSRSVDRERARRVATWPALLREHQQIVRNMQRIADGGIVVVDDDEKPRLQPVEIPPDDAETGGSD